MKLQPERRSFVRTQADPHPRWYHTFHRLWTKAVGKPGYVKRDWQELEEALLKAGKQVKS
jgi:hypothetical protein